MTSDGARRVFSFGVYEVDEARGELRKHGTRIKLHAQPFQALVLLLERQPEIVSREEMRQRLWGDDTFVDFDHGLNSAVNKIRDALNDSAAHPRYVETVPGKGYRFIAPVSRTGTAPLAAPSVLSTAEELPAPPRKVVRVLLALIQMLYLAFYLIALANLREIDDIFVGARLPSPAALMAVVIATAAALIPVRLYVLAAVAFDLPQLPAKFARLWPFLLPFDLLWALSPFLLAHHVAAGLAIGMSAILVYLPFAQRSVVLMYGRRG